MRKKPSKQALDNAVKAIVPFVIEMLKEEKIKKTPQLRGVIRNRDT